MADIYIYADETGNLDYDAAGKQGASRFFGFGTVVFDQSHAQALWDGLVLRVAVAAGQGGQPGLNQPRGFHAREDSNLTRAAVLNELARQAPRFDSTFLLKENGYADVKARGGAYLYKLTWFLHFKYVAEQVSAPGDRLVVVVASLGTRARQTEARMALEDVCQQMDRSFVLCIWDAATSWGVQLADYALWADQRDLERRSGTWYAEYVKPLAASRFFPWGRDPK